jgi:hypothetical protein
MFALKDEGIINWFCFNLTHLWWIEKGMHLEYCLR